MAKIELNKIELKQIKVQKMEEDKLGFKIVDSKKYEGKQEVICIDCGKKFKVDIVDNKINTDFIKECPACKRELSNVLIPKDGARILV